MPDENTHGGYTVIFQNMLQHQVNLATMKTTLNFPPPPMTLKARDQMVGRKTHRQEDLKMIEKTYKSVEMLKTRSASA